MATINSKKDIQKLLRNSAGIKLDIGCGAAKNKGFVGIDMLPLEGVDIVWDIEQTPWPLPDESVSTAFASHVLEHIDPHKGIFIKVMDEIWRVLKNDGQFAFVVPYAGSHGYYQDPTHCNPINETTMCYFDPLDPTGLYTFYRPKPWKIEMQAMNRNGILEVLLRKRQWDKSYLNISPPLNIVDEQTQEYFEDSISIHGL